MCRGVGAEGGERQGEGGRGERRREKILKQGERYGEGTGGRRLKKEEEGGGGGGGGGGEREREL